jgi:hypothetical protein
MSIRALIVPCMLLALLTPVADASTKHSKIKRSAKYTHVTGARHFKMKKPKKQKITQHGRH